MQPTSAPPPPSSGSPGRRKPYFPPVPGAPPPLRATVSRQVRFEEVDLLGIVWHGRYASYFEDARVALGQRYGIGYETFREHQTPVPIKQMYVDYRLPLRYGDEFTVEAIMHFTEAARLNVEFVIRNAAGETATTGYSVQLMLDRDFQLLVTPPPFFQDVCRRWQAGELA
ncbi:MAG: acyl-CoA thioesterase [Lentisphaeria bacterium]|nr:acyl-CoA thioesterase [Lentisphaeria bacterium]